MKPVDVVNGIMDFIGDEDCIDIVKTIIDAIDKTTTLFKIEEIVKNAADFERI